MHCYDEISESLMDATKVKISQEKKKNPVYKKEGKNKMQCYDEISESLMTAAKVKISPEKKKKKKKKKQKQKNPAKLDPPLRFVRPEWFSHPIYWCPRDEFFCLHHDEICEQVESVVLRVLDYNYPLPHLEMEKKNKQEDEQLDMDLTLVFEKEKEEEEVRPQQLNVKFEEPQESSHKKGKHKNKKKNKQKENDMEVHYNNIQKNKEQEEEKEDAIILKYRPPPKDHRGNIQEGQNYDVIPLLFSKLRDYLIKYIGHQVLPQKLGGKLEETQEKSNKKKKKQQQQQLVNDLEEDNNNNNIQKNKEQKEGEKKNDANIIKYQSPSKYGSWNIQKGEKYDVKPLLFSKLRDYLIKYNGQQVRPQQLGGKFEEPQEESHKKSKNKQQENDMEVHYNNIQKNKEQEEKNKDAIIPKYHPPSKDHPGNIQEGQKYDVIPLLFSKLRDYLIKYIGHQVLPQQLGGKLEEPQEESNKKSKKKKKQQQVNDMEEDNNNNNIKKNKEQEGEKKNDASIIKYQSPSKYGPWNIQTGEKYDVKLVLFSKLRDYLIKYNGQQVKCKQLKDRYILLYFWWLSDDILTLHEDGVCFGLDEYLGEMYRANNPKGNFEVVFVALGNNERAFHDSFSRMPWLAIPHEDQEGRDLFIKMFDIPSSPSVRAVLFSPNGTALRTNPQSTFCIYGPDGFPFTDGRISRMHREYNALLKEFMLNKQKPSLSALLGDYLISSEDKQVCTSVLEDKIVSLYFFEASPMGFQSAEKLLNIWKLMKTSEAYKNFEIVLINKAFDGNMQFAKARFKDKFGDIPWYSLPLFYNSKCCQVFWVHILEWKMKESCFIVLEPDRYQCLSYFGYDILDKFGIDAYPFTLEKAVIVEKGIQRKQLVLNQLLSPLAPLRRGDSTCNEEDTTVSTLSGKCVLLLFATRFCYECGSFLSKLKKMYVENKGTDNHFEVIYISLDCVKTPSSFPRGIQRMPWLIHAYAPRFAEDLAERVFQIFPSLPAIAAFGPDGHLEAKESNLAFKEVWNSKYPFIQADMDEVVCKELMDMYEWDLEDLFPRIFSKRKRDVPCG